MTYRSGMLEAGFGAASSSVVFVPFHSRGDAALVLTNQANAEQGLGNSPRNETYFDSTDFTEVRLVARVTVVSASANSPRLYPQYWDGAAWVTVGTGSGAEAASLASAVAVKTNWITLPSGAKADLVWRIAMNGGDGVADPAVGSTGLQFR